MRVLFFFSDCYTLLMNFFAGFIPYIAVLIGMVLLKSAWLAIGLYHLGIIAFLLYRSPPNVVGRLWSGYNRRLLIPSAMACTLAAPIIFFLWPWFSRPDVPLNRWLSQVGLEGLSWILFIPYFALVHPVLEELFWRTLTDGTYKLVEWKDLLFAGYHLLVLGSLIKGPWLLVVFGSLVIASSFWRKTAHRFSGYGIAVVTHAIADAAVLIGVIWLLHIG
jgi:hypothetical protein